MSLLSSLNTGVSGLNATGQELSVIGNNISNVNTIGYKGSSISFGDVLDQTISGLSGSSQLGLGVAVNSVTPQLTQGSLETTSNPLDVAINGQGFFMVKNNNVTNYTRDGEFQTNQSGDIVTSSGAILQGYLADATGAISGQIGNIQLQGSTSLPQASSTAALSVNLPPLATGAAVPAWLTTWEGTTTPPASGTYNNMTSFTAYDSQGNAHQVDAYFVNTSTAAATTWQVNYVYEDANGDYQSAGAGQNLAFDTSGNLTTSPATAPLALNWANGTAAGAVSIDLTGTTQVAGSFAVNSVNQNGYAPGSLQSVQIGTNGLVTGTYSNGQTKNIAQLCLAQFSAPTQLTSIGNNMFAQSGSSGQPIVGAPQTAGFGSTLSSSLEQSNVDISQEFTNMIAAQSAFEANSKVITTTDTLLNNLMQMST